MLFSDFWAAILLLLLLLLFPSCHNLLLLLAPRPLLPLLPPAAAAAAADEEATVVIRISDGHHRITLERKETATWDLGVEGLKVVCMDGDSFRAKNGSQGESEKNNASHLDHFSRAS